VNNYRAAAEMIDLVAGAPRRPLALAAARR
jgi:hypothetical protein